jgi:TolA-binding protein
MRSRLGVLIVAVAVLVSASAWWLYAQSPTDRAGSARQEGMNSSFAELTRKIDQIANDAKQHQQETNRKLDQIMSTQETILKQLDVIRIRASSR